MGNNGETAAQVVQVGQSATPSAKPRLTKTECEGISALLTEREVLSMRSWLADCIWYDADADYIATTPEWVIIRAVAYHYEGGVTAFLYAECVPSPAESRLTRYVLSDRTDRMQRSTRIVVLDGITYVYTEGF